MEDLNLINAERQKLAKDTLSELVSIGADIAAGCVVTKIVSGTELKYSMQDVDCWLGESGHLPKLFMGIAAGDQPSIDALRDLISVACLYVAFDAEELESEWGSLEYLNKWAKGEIWH